jgi:hypothetical protein
MIGIFRSGPGSAKPNTYYRNQPMFFLVPRDSVSAARLLTPAARRPTSRAASNYRPLHFKDENRDATEPRYLSINHAGTNCRTWSDLDGLNCDPAQPQLCCEGHRPWRARWPICSPGVTVPNGRLNWVCFEKNQFSRSCYSPHVDAIALRGGFILYEPQDLVGFLWPHFR